MSRGRNHRSRIRLLRHSLADAEAIVRAFDAVIRRLEDQLDAARFIIVAQEREIERTATATGQVVRLAEQAQQIHWLRRERDELRERLGLLEQPPFA